MPPPATAFVSFNEVQPERDAPYPHRLATGCTSCLGPRVLNSQIPSTDLLLHRWNGMEGRETKGGILLPPPPPLPRSNSESARFNQSDEFASVVPPRDPRRRCIRSRELVYTARRASTTTKAE